jgi:hypothetical protein
MFGKKVNMSGRVKVMLGVAASVALLGGSKAMAQVPAGLTPLYTTVDDFTGANINNWSGSVTSVEATTAWDADGSTTDGAVNNYAPGTAGSLEIDQNGEEFGWGPMVDLPSSNTYWNATFMSAIDPGSTPGTTVAFSGTLYLTYSAQLTGPDAYYEIGLGLEYPGDGYWQQNWQSSLIDDGTINGLPTYTAVIPYTIGASNSNGGFTITPWMNSGVYGAGIPGIDDTFIGPIYIDSVSVPTSQVPEPATLGVLGAGLAMLTVRRRRHA